MSEVANVGFMGFWVLADGKAYFVPYDDYPAFKHATFAQILNLQMPVPWQLHWPDLDIDIEVEALEFPEKYPLKFH